MKKKQLNVYSFQNCVLLTHCNINDNFLSDFICKTQFVYYTIPPIQAQSTYRSSEHFLTCYICHYSDNLKTSICKAIKIYIHNHNTKNNKTSKKNVVPTIQRYFQDNYTCSLFDLECLKYRLRNEKLRFSNPFLHHT